MKKKAKTVRAWCYSLDYCGLFVDLQDTKREAIAHRKLWAALGAICGPIVRIEVPAPRSEK